jgi:APA family basic amino acid/polyamine antiporter
LAGVSFILGKIGSVSAISLAAAAYIYPTAKVQVAIAALLVMTVINFFGINRTAMGALVLSLPTIALLLLVGFTGLVQPGSTIDTQPSLVGVISAASLIFFAFAGYARVATLGDEVRDPSRNVPRSITIGLIVVLTLYLMVGNALSLGLGPTLENSVAPILGYTNQVMPWIPSEVVIAIAASACLGSLLSLLAGISRTGAAMAKDAEIPRVFSKRSKSFNSPWAAEMAIAAISIVLVSSGDIVWTIGISSFLVLCYYAIANLAAYKQLTTGMLTSKILALAGLASCILLAGFVPLQSLLIGIGGRALALALRAGLKKSRVSS